MSRSLRRRRGRAIEGLVDVLHSCGGSCVFAFAFAFAFFGVKGCFTVHDA